VAPGQLVLLEGGQAALVDGVAMRVVHLGRALGWSGPQDDKRADAELPALVVRAADGPALLTVDELLEEREVVVRAGSQRFAGVPGLLGTSLIEDGSVALVMSPTVCLRIGLAAPSELERRAEAPSETRRILLAEDTLTTRELERSILETAGYSVLVARDGADAWQLLQDQTVDVVVSDVNMPRMDGIALCRAIRSSPRHAGLPLVLVTSLASPDDRRQGLEAGADAYLTKSGFGREELLETLDRLL
jgi:two-component system chemotaxis sensor kinase CheA